MGDDSDAGNAGDSSRGDDPSLDSVFEILAEERRRHVIRILAAHGPTIALADLADEVAAREFGTSLAEIDEREVMFVYLSLYHQHVPRLADAGLVAYDQDRDLVTVTGDTDPFERFLALATDADR